ncbi:hypothetical protein MAR_008185 [Mya arenaria]|uniref:Uncharacterized protein n=1 Tax=Mya arenaria TaxID=6604 RepID=A0ABY7DVB7_MYAAR|nr:hypothetical protein MAR_008185 [Mya arenaria]
MTGNYKRYYDFIRNATTTNEYKTVNKYAAFLPIPAVLSLILILIGFVTPGWAGLEIGGTFYGFGLWYDYLCKEGSDCETKVFAHNVKSKDLADAAENSMVKYRVMATIFSLVTSGTLQIIKSITVFKKYEHIVGESPYTFPYSLFLFGAGGIMSAFTMFFIMGIFCYSASH